MRLAAALRTPSVCIRRNPAGSRLYRAPQWQRIGVAFAYPRNEGGEAFRAVQVRQATFLRASGKRSLHQSEAAKNALPEKNFMGGHGSTESVIWVVRAGR
jgi:hypothetical protein